MTRKLATARSLASLKPNTKYLVKLTNKNSVAGKIQTVISWYDEVSV